MTDTIVSTTDSKPKPIYYQTMAQVTSKHNVPWRVLKRCKIHPLTMHCFDSHHGQRIHWHLLKPLLEIHKDELYNVAKDQRTERNESGVQFWDLRKKKATALMSEIELEELKKNILYREDVEASICSIVNAQRNLLRSKLVVDLPQHLVGLPVETIQIKMEDVVNSVVSLMSNLKV